ncbi:MAG: hypothetical protein SVG88_09200 [Halobacteriales archaeon]|nr:hypothetical protein [Halobacteriales archaeon]
MKTQFARAVLFAFYQLSVIIGIVMMPIALLARQSGVVLPIHRLVDRLETAYERFDQPSHA